MPARVVLDDTDSRIQYEGSWILTAAGATDAWGNDGPAYNDTLHETRKDASLSLQFNGTAVGIWATIDTTNNQPRPSWTYTIDGKVTDRIEAEPEKRTNYYQILSQSVEGPLEHLIMLNVTVPDGATFRLDQILYTALQDIAEGEVLIVHEDNAMVSYQPPSSWIKAGMSYDTNVSGSSLTLQFMGTDATFYCILSPNFNTTTAKYTIDGGPATVFDIPSHTGNNLLYNQPLFSVTRLSPAEHSLVVTYTGQQSNRAPLAFDYFYVTLPPRKELPSLTPSGSGSLSSSTGLTGSSDSPRPSKPTGAIVGGSVGGVVVLIIIGFTIFIFVRRGRRHRRRSPGPSATPFIAAHRSQDAAEKQANTASAPNSDSGGIWPVDASVRSSRLNHTVDDSPPDYASQL